MSFVLVGLIHNEAGSFGISFPDFPGVVSAAQSPGDAIVRGGDTLAFHIRGMIDDGERIPQLRTIEELWKDDAFLEDAKGAIIVYVPVEIPPPKPVFDQDMPF